MSNNYGRGGIALYGVTAAVSVTPAPGSNRFPSERSPADLLQVSMFRRFERPE